MTVQESSGSAPSRSLRPHSAAARRWRPLGWCDPFGVIMRGRVLLRHVPPQITPARSSHSWASVNPQRHAAPGRAVFDTANVGRPPPGQLCGYQRAGVAPVVGLSLFDHIDQGLISSATTGRAAGAVIELHVIAGIGEGHRVESCRFRVSGRASLRVSLHDSG